MASKPETSETCPVCLDTVKDPQILACQHKLCSHCLQQHVSATVTAENKFNCPSCRRECEVPEGAEETKTKVVEQPTNDGHVSKPGASAAMCTNSDHGQATVFCSDCDEFYCQSCASSHQVIKSTRNHKMEPIDKMSPDEIPQAKSTCNTCTEHEEQPLDIVCKRCQQLMCKTCTLFKHEDNLHQELEYAANEAKKELRYMNGEITEYISQQNDKLRAMKQAIVNLGMDVETAKQAVKKAAQQIRDTISSHENDLLAALENHQKEALDKLESVIKETEEGKATASIFKKETESVWNSKNSVDHILLAPRAQKQFRALRKYQQQNISWECIVPKLQVGTRNTNSLKNMLGNVMLQSQVVRMRKKINLGASLYQVKTVNYQPVSGLVVFDDCLCILNGIDLQLHDLPSGRNSTSQVPGICVAGGMALVESALRTVVITDQAGSGNGKIHFVRISPDLKIAHHRVKTIPLKNPSHITACREAGELLVASKDKRRFIICNEEGDVLREIDLENLLRTSHYSRSIPDFECYCVTTVKEGYAALTCNKDRTASIQFVDRNGKCYHTYSGESTLPGQRIKGGKHMVKEYMGRLIVADSENHRLHLVDTNGQFVQFLLTQDDGIHNPQCMFFDEASSRLYIAHGTDYALKVLVYRWPSRVGDTETNNLKLNLQLMRQ